MLPNRSLTEVRSEESSAVLYLEIDSVFIKVAKQPLTLSV